MASLCSGCALSLNVELDDLWGSLQHWIFHQSMILQFIGAWRTMNIEEDTIH